jgi:ADP-heptose:LPS heptosyltransferase
VLKSPQHLLVFRFSALGDVAMTVPVVKSLLQQYPGLHITYVSNAFVAPLFTGIDRLHFHAADLKGRHNGVKGLYTLYRELNRTYNFDAIADLHNVLRTKILRFFFVTSFKPIAVIDKGRKEKKELTRKKNKILKPLRATIQRYADVFAALGVPVQLNQDLAAINHQANSNNQVNFQDQASANGQANPNQQGSFTNSLKDPSINDQASLDSDQQNSFTSIHNNLATSGLNESIALDQNLHSTPDPNGPSSYDSNELSTSDQNAPLDPDRNGFLTSDQNDLSAVDHQAFTNFLQDSSSIKSQGLPNTEHQEPITHGNKSLLSPNPQGSLFSGPNRLFLIGVAPFAQHAEKMYPHEKMKEVLRLLLQHQEVKVLLFGGGKTEVPLLQEWERAMPGLESVAGKMSFQEELKLIAQLDVMLSMDSANMHLASLSGVPVISIWGATHPFAGFYGWGQSPNDAIQVNLYCRPCSVFGNKPCFRGDLACMHSISPVVVYNKIMEKLHNLQKGK